MHEHLIFFKEQLLTHLRRVASTLRLHTVVAFEILDRHDAVLLRHAFFTETNVVFRPNSFLTPLVFEVLI